jgi:hypothetical protein
MGGITGGLGYKARDYVKSNSFIYKCAPRLEFELQNQCGDKLKRLEEILEMKKSQDSRWKSPEVKNEMKQLRDDLTQKKEELINHFKKNDH